MSYLPLDDFWLGRSFCREFLFQFVRIVNQDSAATTQWLYESVFLADEWFV
jgi:hypothetical protein